MDTTSINRTHARPRLECPQMMWTPPLLLSLPLAPIALGLCCWLVFRRLERQSCPLCGGNCPYSLDDDCPFR